MFTKTYFFLDILSNFLSSAATQNSFKEEQRDRYNNSRITDASFLSLHFYHQQNKNEL